MTLSERARSVWAKFGYNPESDQWLPLWLHLLDSSAVAEHLAERWLAPRPETSLNASSRDRRRA